MSCMISSPLLLMVVALIFWNMTVVCHPSGNAYALHSNAFNITTTKKDRNSVNNVVIVLKEKQKQIKRMYQNLLSYLSFPSLANLTRIVSKHHEYILPLLALREEEYTKTIYKVPVKYRSAITKR